MDNKVKKEPYDKFARLRLILLVIVASSLPITALMLTWLRHSLPSALLTMPLAMMHPMVWHWVMGMLSWMNNHMMEVVMVMYLVRVLLVWLIVTHWVISSKF
ncbi:hypothetical protein LOZ80_03315 [Paenibacillus sp. HWE-109]|uniref:hypothetical protein n=1 Tax=Paenibacillus sp. HWE-109 TaxID=1306526 RepID=UPI001EDF8693|nr:hypothetical protein [Paenibacillus sp. HWE-109]UKS27988.1 hypothetical protein LOZ80_03315 [Paenibacillus sp. HWE-109]